MCFPYPFSWIGDKVFPRNMRYPQHISLVIYVSLPRKHISLYPLRYAFLGNDDDEGDVDGNDNGGAADGGGGDDDDEGGDDGMMV